MKFLILAYLLIKLSLAQNTTYKIYPDYKNHPCKRTCDGGRSMTCTYHLTMEHYFTMQKDCLDCQNGNYTACLNPQCIPGDGTQRMVTVFNSMLPGPSIEVCVGDFINVYVTNLIDPETTTVHWHGLHQRYTQWNDGVPGVTQCPILPFTSWKYEFRATEHGTHWYHSHSGSQRADGAYGHLIIRRPANKDPNARLYDKDDHVMSLLDWFPNQESQYYLYKHYRLKEFYNNVATILVNGFGRIINGNSQIARFTVQKGLRYRFRVISAVNVVCPIWISIENHKLLIINTDVNDIEPIEVDSLHIANGERYDFVLEANQSVGQYAIRITGDNICSNSPSLAVLHYQGAPERQLNLIPNFQPPGLLFNCINSKSSSCINYNHITSRNAMDADLKGTPDYKHYFELNIFQNKNPRFRGVGQDKLSTPYINNISFTPPQSPLLLNPQRKEWCNEAYKPPGSCHGDICECLHVIDIRFGALVEFIFADNGRQSGLVHPMHLHGHHFRVIGTGSMDNQTNIRQMDAKNKLVRRFNDPPAKDTIGVPAGGYVVVRFIANNPGFWFVHCHVDFHTIDGMGFVVHVNGFLGIPGNYPRCGDFDGVPFLN